MPRSEASGVRLVSISDCPVENPLSILSIGIEQFHWESDEAIILEMIESGGSLSSRTRFRLAVKAFEAVARYDAAIANYLSSIDIKTGEHTAFSGPMTLQFQRREVMRYGENPHQSAAFYV